MIAPHCRFLSLMVVLLFCDGFTAFKQCDGWKKKGWRRADKKQIKNRRLWQTVDDLRSGKYVEVEKVRAHSGVRGNEIADSLAVDAARSDID